MNSIYDLTVPDIDGHPVALARFAGSVLLIVNTASKCGFTPQYAGLEELYDTYKDHGFAILGFPCDQFGNQEPGDEAEIKSFCSLTYDVTFPMFSKIDVNGPDASPLFELLKEASPGLLGSKAIKWNFTKFLVARDGKVLDRYAPTTKPESLKADIEAALAKQSDHSFPESGHPPAVDPFPLRCSGYPGDRSRIGSGRDNPEPVAPFRGALPVPALRWCGLPSWAAQFDPGTTHA